MSVLFNSEPVFFSSEEQLLDLELSSESDEDHEDFLEVAAVCLEVREHRFWTAEFLQRRESMGDFNLFHELDDERFRNYFRMARPQFSELESILTVSLTGRNTNCRDCLPVNMKLAVCLRYLATGDSFRSIAYSYRLGDRTVGNIVRDVTAAMWTHLQPLYLPTPTTDKWKASGRDFGERWQFPNCIGAIDGKHVTIKAPPNSGSAFYNYKKFFSTVLMAVADANYQLTYVDVGSCGRFSDGGIFRTSSLGSCLSNGTLGIPEDKELCPGGTPMPYVFVADEAFPLQRHIMRPFPRSQLDSGKRIYNYRLSRARRIVENAFGILSARWRVYKRPFECNLQTVDKIVLATCVLHNFLGQTGGHGHISSEEIATSLEENDNQLLDLPRIGNNPSREAFVIRDMFCNYFVNVNPLPWQNQVNSV